MINMKHNFLGRNHSAFIIAEAGVNHNGNIEIAKKLIDAAVDAGVDAIKFQTFKAENLVIKNAEKAEYQKQNTNNTESQYEMLKKLELSNKEHVELSNYCLNKGIMFLSTPFDFESVDLLEKLGVKIYKIGSGDLTNLPLLNYVAERQKPIILSTGMATLGEIEEAVQCIYKTGNENIALMHCTSNYPCKYENVNLKAMNTLQSAFNLPIGYSDHTEGIEVPIVAVGIGAVIIEKHFTLDKKMQGPDHKASLEPQELKAMVNCIRNVEKAIGSPIKHCTEVEYNVRNVARKSIVAARDIKAGDIIDLKDLNFKRPGTGLKPKFYTEIVGKRARHDIKFDNQIEFNMVE